MQAETTVIHQCTQLLSPSADPSYVMTYISHSFPQHRQYLCAGALILMHGHAENINSGNLVFIFNCYFFVMLVSFSHAFHCKEVFPPCISLTYYILSFINISLLFAKLSKSLKMLNLIQYLSRDAYCGNFLPKK